MLHSFRSIRSPTPRAATHPLHHHHPVVTPPKPPPSSSSSSHHQHHHHGITIITTTPPPPQHESQGCVHFVVKQPKGVVSPMQWVRLAVRVSRECGMRLVVDSTAKGAFCFGLDPHRVRLALSHRLGAFGLMLAAERGRQPPPWGAFGGLPPL
ncbi:hypothetical protein Tco_1358567 [Tanacetum coccineum]